MCTGPHVGAHRRWFRPAATSVLLAILGVNTTCAQTIDNIAVCAGRTDATIEDKIEACTAILDAKGESDPQRLAMIYTTRGAYWRSVGNLARAVADQDDAIVLEPTSALLYFNRAVTAQAQEDFDRAASNLDRAIELAPRFLAALQIRADLSYARAAYGDAMRGYDKVLEIDPKSARALTMRGLSKWQGGDAAGGREDISVALRLDAPIAVALVISAKPRPLSSSAQSREPQPDIWHFKGSELALEADGAARRFRYLRPRPQLQMAGIKSGDLLFDGTARGDRISGKAFVFSGKCGARSYEVDGSILAGTVMTTITLTGRRPTLDNDCRPTGNVETSVLELSRAMPPSTPPPMSGATWEPPKGSGTDQGIKKEASVPKSDDDRVRPKAPKAQPKAETDPPRKKTTAEARKSQSDGNGTCADLKSIAASSAVRALLGC